jgi:hypothetical protein
MAFKLRSGNKSPFKSMGSSPVKQRLNKGGEGQDQNKIFNERGEHVGDWIGGKKVMKPTKGMSKKLSDITPAEIKAMKLDEIYPKKSPAKQVKKSTTTAHGQLNDAEIEYQEDLARNKKSTDTTYADGSKKSKREQDFSKRHTAEKAKDKYWYKVDGKPVSKAQYLKYENKPGNMEGGGKTTNHPDVYGKIANNFGRGPKTKK